MAVAPSAPSNETWGGRGNVTTYTDAPSAGGACQYGTTSVRSFAAMSVNLQPNDGRGAWQGGRICGQCARVTTQTTLGEREVVVRIMDKCPDGNCGIDLGGEAGAAVMPDGPGRYAGQWEWISCTGHPEVSDGPPTLFVKEGSNAWWSRVQVRNPPSAVATIAGRLENDESLVEFPFGEEGLENYFSVPAALLAADANVELHVTFTEGSEVDLTLRGTDLAKEGTGYALPAVTPP